MSAAAPSAPAAARQDGPATAFATVINAAVSTAATGLDRQVTRWTERLNAVGLAGAEATLHGRNPFRAAVRGAWQAGSPAVRAAIVTGIVATILLLLASPVLLLVFLLSLLVIAAVMKARRAAS